MPHLEASKIFEDHESNPSIPKLTTPRRFKWHSIARKCATRSWPPNPARSEPGLTTPWKTHQLFRNEKEPPVKSGKWANLWLVYSRAIIKAT